MPAYNEADVIFHAVGALVAEGVDVYLLDHESTDGTADAARPWLGRGLVHIESFPGDAGYPERNRNEMVWRDILRRVGEVSGEVAADWYLFVNPTSSAKPLGRASRSPTLCATSASSASAP